MELVFEDDEKKGQKLGDSFVLLEKKGKKSTSDTLKSVTVMWVVVKKNVFCRIRVGTNKMKRSGHNLGL